MRRCINGALLLWCALLPAFSQALHPEVLIYYAMPGDKAWTWEKVVVDPPMTLTADAAGQVHLGLSIVFAPGSGVFCPTQISSAGALVVNCDVVTAFVPTKANLQSAISPIVCTSSGGNGAAYVASCGTALTKMEPRQLLAWFPDVTNAAGATLSIDTLPKQPLLTRSGSPLPANSLVEGALYWIWNDGSNWRIGFTP